MHMRCPPSDYSEVFLLEGRRQYTSFRTKRPETAWDSIYGLLPILWVVALLQILQKSKNLHAQQSSTLLKVKIAENHAQPGLCTFLSSLLEVPYPLRSADIGFLGQLQFIGRTPSSHLALSVYIRLCTPHNEAILSLKNVSTTPSFLKRLELFWNTSLVTGSLSDLFSISLSGFSLRFLDLFTK